MPSVSSSASWSDDGAKWTRGILEVSELAGDRVVELRVVDELRVVGLITCVRGEIVQGDQGPVGGVAQVVCHRVKVGVVHGEEGQEEEGEKQEEVKEEVEENQGRPHMCMA